MIGRSRLHDTSGLKHLLQTPLPPPRTHHLVISTLSHCPTPLDHTFTPPSRRDTAELQLISLAPKTSGALRDRIASHPLVDVSDVIFETSSRRPDAFALDYHKAVWSFTDAQDQQEWEKLEGWRPHEVAAPVSRSKDGKVWVFAQCVLLSCIVVSALVCWRFC